MFYKLSFRIKSGAAVFREEH